MRRQLCHLVSPFAICHFHVAIEKPSMWGMFSAARWMVSFLLWSFLVGLMTLGDDISLGRGFGDSISWRTFEKGLQESKASKKPMMLIIHKSWCGACKAFKPKFAESKEIADLSKNFIMVNTEDDEEPVDPQFSPDGGYIPRVLFLDPSGQVMLDVYNESGNKNYRYYYYDSHGVIGSMKRALELMDSNKRKANVEL